MDLGRVDSLVSSQHDRWAFLDHALLRSMGVRCARESLRWHLIERVAGRYDFSSAKRQVAAANAAGVAIVWGLCHWGVPDHLDVMSADFPKRFAEFVFAAERALRAEGSDIAGWVPMNEMSFWAWAGGETGGFHPFHTRRGDALKWQLVLAHVAGVRALRDAGADEPIVVCEPLICIHPRTSDPQTIEHVRAHLQASTAAVDWILAIDPTSIDIVGLNYYGHNQWTDDGTRIPREDPRYRPLRELLRDKAQHFSRPIVLSETGAEEPDGVDWMGYVAEESEAALRMGVPLRGVCIYPVLDYGGWDDARHCPCGPIGQQNGRRIIRAEHRPVLRRLTSLGALAAPAEQRDVRTAAFATDAARADFGTC
ncbi:glycoside hydrolase family 1 protein [Plastoroseomonas arctica]|uniref:Family 1 glycosylhydrolase n=1 Tax=Plastoroseomonas arctica TaxID=1509237 RepID=A0AAF1KUR6_9PROT|nr:family 1 glycosylhydrolase [Plastoroseomonas arctica]MBR0656832.1 family 1 glycosylhydrolase [Plastoroseomonas arctica]